ncbi:hypothetical protein QTN80_02520 [Arachnia propionica]
MPGDLWPGLLLGFQMVSTRATPSSRSGWAGFKKSHTIVATP